MASQRWASLDLLTASGLVRGKKERALLDRFVRFGRWWPVWLRLKGSWHGLDNLDRVYQLDRWRILEARQRRIDLVSLITGGVSLQGSSFQLGCPTQN